MSINCCQFLVSGDFSAVSPFQGDQYTSNGIWLRKSHNSAKRYTLYPLYIIDHTFQKHPKTLWRMWMNLPNKKTLKKQKVFTESVRKHPNHPENFPKRAWSPCNFLPNREAVSTTSCFICRLFCASQ